MPDPADPLVIEARRAVTGSGQVVDRARLYLRGNRIEALRAAHQAAPQGYQQARRLQSGGTLYPGLLDLHNHLPYNVLGLWQVPQRYEASRAWRDDERYARDVSAPMSALAQHGASATQRALVRYVEVKLMVGGVSSVQGKLSRFPATAPHFAGLVRNIEAPDAPGLTRFGSQLNLPQDAAERARLQQRLTQGEPLVVHLAEAVRDQDGEFDWLAGHGLLRPNLVCIHCLGLNPAQQRAFNAAGSGRVWSPLSNLLLYGQTLEFEDLGTHFALGSDWSPSGSKNLLMELKVAWLHASRAGRQPPADLPERLAHALTLGAARVVHWDEQLGSLEAGKLADLLLLDSLDPDPYRNLLRATERHVQALFIDGQARHGDHALLLGLGLPAAGLERLHIGGRAKALALDQPGAALQGLSLAQAQAQLAYAMARLLEPGATPAELLSGGPDGLAPEIELDLQAHPDTRPLGIARLEPLQSVALDPLCAADDAQFFATLESIAHLPAYLKDPQGLRRFYFPAP